MTTHFSGPKVRDEALALAKGSYQRNLLYGYEAWSGASLKGRARDWSSKYAHSRQALINRLNKAGLMAFFVKEGKRKVLLVRRPPKPKKPPTVWARILKADSPCSS